MAIKKEAPEVVGAPKTVDKNGFSGETTVVNLFYDGDKYKDPLFVQINGRSFLVKRGEPVVVPTEVAEVIKHSLKQDGKTRQMIRQLSGAPKDMGEM